MASSTSEFVICQSVTSYRAFSPRSGFIQQAQDQRSLDPECGPKHAVHMPAHRLPSHPPRIADFIEFSKRRVHKRATTARSPLHLCIEPVQVVQVLVPGHTELNPTCHRWPLDGLHGGG